MNRKIEVFPEGVKENVTVTSVEEVEATDKRLGVNVTLRNDSDEAVRMDHYSITLTTFTAETIAEESGDRAQDRIQAATTPQYDTTAQEPTPSGETVTLGFSIQVPSDSDATIQSYLVSVACGGAYDPPRRR